LTTAEAVESRSEQHGFAVPIKSADRASPTS
jgi:hypothetical protein